MGFSPSFTETLLSLEKNKTRDARLEKENETLKESE